ncbi:MAG: hypothetical protein ACTIA3_10440 [Corynebacterium casei]|uniref:Uncharacterized protein n=2 Tax=Corynebacterium casei TaxID=160386 RepID=G7HZT9_9CORY|nr:hypothetical protein [Corynebacterium casei]MDN5705588.1 hypothetical protein [Corynebacterium casei]MDN5727947.1 hypothetical protein [Corynebacterium casei]MDN5740097.1 hypothetical protein [Corynebacterium casei]MDN5783346.1 hypothetical protein [Corynebacterium casei]MDN5799225.1 hypothetical protein [Corynebacterium casei]
MRNKVASIAFAGAAFAVGIAAPAPAMVNPASTHSCSSRRTAPSGLWKTPREKPREGSSTLGVEHCGPLSTQRC